MNNEVIELNNVDGVEAALVIPRGESAVVSPIDELAYNKTSDVVETDTGTKVSFGESLNSDFNYDYTMDKKLFKVLWSMEKAGVLKQILANKVLTSYAKEHLQHDIDLNTVSKTVKGKAKKLKNQFIVSYGVESINLEEAIKLLIAYKFDSTLPKIIKVIIKDTVYKEDKESNENILDELND